MTTAVSSTYNFGDEYDGADAVPPFSPSSYAQETASIQQNLSLFLEVMDSLSSDDDVKRSDILKELYHGPLHGVQEKVMLLITQFQNDEGVLKALLDLSDCMEEVLTQYLRRAGASSSSPRSSLPTTTTNNNSDRAGNKEQEEEEGVSDSDYDSEADDEEEITLDHPSGSKRVGQKKDKGKGKVALPYLFMDVVVTSQDDGAIPSLPIAEEDAHPAVQEARPPVFLSGYKCAEQPGECPICCDEAPVSELFIFDTCEHQYCRECLQGYFANLVAERRVLNITCPFPGCKTQVEYHQVQSVVTVEMFQKYEECTFLAALNTDPTVKWCPRPGCGNAIIGDPNNPRCECTEPNCRYEFCFLCSEPWHQDATCEQYQEWKLENGLIDTKFTTWAKKNTKKCPQCKTMIEKIAGCNHMTCSSCKFEFCWLCGGKYSSSHFDVFNVLGCPGMQSGSKQFGVARRMGMRALIGTGLVLGGILGTALAIPAAVVAGPIYGGYKLHQRRKRSNRRRRYDSNY